MLELKEGILKNHCKSIYKHFAVMSGRQEYDYLFIFCVLRLKNQIQELDKSLEMLEVLKKRKNENNEITNHFRLADHVYIKAKIPPVEKIGLWLGVSQSFIMIIMIWEWYE